ncbi:MAG: cytochrome c oxidase subunit II [Ardenticatenaceae bacterium]|nr:cytochrome c oxidase subunit II [Ardenticatenaceae bacterium]HBY99038.1 cytochrome c oxidase subunit II [Chloroflexota bacterium]
MGGIPFFPQEASTAAPQVDALFFFLVGLSTLITLGIAALIIYFAVKYRRRSEDEIGEQIVGSTALEFVWTIIPTGLAMIAFFWAAQLYLHRVSPPSNSLEVYVVAKQWMWKFQHVDGQREIDELHVPVGQPVKLTMTSQDVIHSFFVPAFRVKQDVLPGRYTTTWFEATKTGQYRLFCTQYCGTEHAQMTGSVIVMEPDEYEAWLSGGGGPGAQPAPQSPAAAGQQLFQQLGCSGCHKPDGSGPGPSLLGVFGHPVQLESGQTVIADESYVRESILNPTAKVVASYQPIMPSFQGRVSEEQLLQLIAYVKSLGSQQPGTPPSAPPGGPTPQSIPSRQAPAQVATPAGTPAAGTTPASAPAAGTPTAGAQPTP